MAKTNTRRRGKPLTTGTQRKPLVIGSNGIVQQLQSGDTLTPASLPVVVASGGSHAPGAMPDPGSVATSNRPKLATDQGNYAWLAGQWLAWSFISTDESTASSSFVALTTADSVTFTLDAVTSIVMIEFMAQCYCSSAAVGTGTIEFVVDGAGDSNNAAQFRSAATGVSGSITMQAQAILANGSHTLSVQYKGSGATMHWYSRLLKVVGLS